MFDALFDNAPKIKNIGHTNGYDLSGLIWKNHRVCLNQCQEHYYSPRHITRLKESGLLVQLPNIGDIAGSRANVFCATDGDVRFVGTFPLVQKVTTHLC
jgi:hypothetical protein